MYRHEGIPIPDTDRCPAGGLFFRNGDLKLLKSSALRFKQLKDNIWYLAAYESDEEYFVIFFETDADVIDRETEYRGIIYASDSYGELKRYDGYEIFTPWQAVIELLKHVNGE